jgi:hypothetical protein
MFLDDPDYIIKLDRSQGSIRSVSRGSIVESDVSRGHGDIHEGADGKDLDTHVSDRRYMETDFSSPHNSEMESEVGIGPKYVHSVPSPTYSAPHHSSYASNGPSSTPQLQPKAHSFDVLLSSSAHRPTSPDKHWERRQPDSPLLAQQKAEPDSVAAETRSKSPSVYLGNNLDFDKEGFKQYLNEALNVGDGAHPTIPPQSGTFVDRYGRSISLRDRHMSSVSNQMPGYPNYPSLHSYYHDDTHSIGASSTHTQNRSMSSSVMAIQGDPHSLADVRSYTPSVVGSSVDGANVARQSWIDEDNTDYQRVDQTHPHNHRLGSDHQRRPSMEHYRQYQHPGTDHHSVDSHPTTTERYHRHSMDHSQHQSAEEYKEEQTPHRSPAHYPHYLRRIRSDNQMRPSNRDPYSTYPKPRGLVHVRSAESNRLVEIMKKKRERRGTCKEMTGFSSVDEFFEHVWTSKGDLRPREGEAGVPPPDIQGRQRATTLN